jgi:hypothetical protein
MYDGDGAPLFPFYWSPNPRLIKGPDVAHLSPFEMESVAFLNSFGVLSTKELVRLETNPKGVVEYLSKYFNISFLFVCLMNLFSYSVLTFMFVPCREDEDDF